MVKHSAGLLLYRHINAQPQVLLVHPGGPFFTKKDKGWWTVPKGEITAGEEPLKAAIREFEEETGYKPAGHFILLKTITQKGGKQVQCWAIEGNLDPKAIKSNEFALQWPPKSGKMQYFPEIDSAEWFTFTEAKEKINERQRPFLEELSALLQS